MPHTEPWFQACPVRVLITEPRLLIYCIIHVYQLLSNFQQTLTHTCTYTHIRVHTGLESFSGWLKSSSSSSSDHHTSAPSHHSPSSSSPSPPAVSQTRDRLLHSEIRELQVKLAQIEKENHELRQLLKASGNDSRAALLGRQVLGWYIHNYIQNVNEIHTK